jgi:hypothetical protein
MKTPIQELPMKSMITWGMLALVSFASSGMAGELGYNLHIVPSTPQAGAPFVVVFGSNECEIWVLPPQGEPPVVTVQGSTVRLEVDLLPLANCTFPPEANTLSVPGLPAGDYQLELIAREYLHPGNDLLVQTIAFEVGPAVTISPFAIPADNKIALALLAGLILDLSYLSRRRT